MLRRAYASGSLRRLPVRNVVLGAMPVLTLLATLQVSPPVLLVWNATPSSPTGLYSVNPWAEPQAGDMAIAWAPSASRRLAARRHYLPQNVPLVKRVAAVAGDRVCALGPRVTVNGKLAVRRRKHDPAGRALPRWQGCIRLAKGELFLLTPDQPLAFDGRYFGVISAKLVVGRATLRWRS